MAADDRDENARLAELTAALIHRFNNVLMGIQPHVEVIKRAGRDNERVLGSATQIETALRKAKMIMSEVSRLAKPLTLNSAPLPITEWFDSLRRDVQPLATNPLDLKFDSEPGLVITGDRELLTRAVVHLVMNAVEAMPNGGAVSVSARESRDGIELQVADNGTGINDQTRARMFEPLFTTKRNNAGLGLPIVQQIVEAHGGTIRLDSNEDSGTTVVVNFLRPKA